MEQEAVPKPKRKLFTRKRALYILGMLVVLGIATIFILPFAIREVIEYELRTHGHENPIVDSVYFNPFTATLIVRGLSGGSEAEDFIEAGHAHFVMDWLALLRRNVRVKTVVLEDIRVFVRQDESLIWRVGRVDARELPTRWKSYTILNLPVGVGVESVALRNVEAVFHNWDIQASALITEGRISGLRTWTAENPAPFELVMLVNGSPVNVTGTTTPFDESATINLAVTIESLPLDSLATMAAGFGVMEVAGAMDANFDATATFLLADETVDASVTGQFALAAITATYETYKTRSDAVAWDGTVRLAGALDAPTIQTDGALSITNAAFNDETQHISAHGGDAIWRGTAELQLGDAMTLIASGSLDGSSFSVNATDGLFTEATLGGLSGSVDQVQFAAGDAAELSVAVIRGGARDIAVNGPAGSEGRIESESGEFEVKDFLGVFSGNKSVITASLTGSVQEVAATDINPELLDAELDRGDVSLTGLRIDAAESNVRVDATAEFVGAGIDAALASLPASGQATKLRGNLTLAATFPRDGEMELRAQGVAEASDVTVMNTDSNLEVVRLAQGNLNGLSADGVRSIKVAAATLERPRLLQRPDAGADSNDTYVATFGTVSINEVALTDTRATAADIVIDGLQGYVAITEEGDIEPLELFSAFLPDDSSMAVPKADENEAQPGVVLASEPPAASAQPADSAADFSVRADVIELKGETLITVEDRSVTPAASIEVRELIARLQNLDTEAPDSLAPIAIEATLGETSRLRLAGEAAPLSAQPSADLQAQIQSIVLPDLTGYSQRNIGYKIDSGVFSADCDIKIDKGQLQTQNNLLINHLMLTKLNEEELTEMDNQLGMPVNAAVNLLRDGNGDIELTVPVEGDLNDPEIKIGQVMRKAISGAMKKSVLAVFAPLRIFGKDKEDAPLNEALAFRDIVFEAASVTYDPSSNEYLDEIARIMKQYPGVSIRLSGVAGEADRQALTVQAGATPATSSGDGQPVQRHILVPAGEGEKYAETTSDAVTEASIAPAVPDEQLLKLADSRAQAVRAYLVDTAGVDAARLFVGLSVIDIEGDGTQPPRVEVGL